MWIKRIAGALLALLVVALGAAFAARALYLPATTCSVGYDTVTGLDLEIDYASVRAKLGCDGQLASAQELAPGLKQEIYRWRGDAWPFGSFEGLFYNGILHGKDVRWLTLDFTWPAAAPAAAAPAGQPKR